MKTAHIWTVEALLNPKLAGQSNVTKASELVHCDNPPSTNSFTYVRGLNCAASAKFQRTQT